MTEDVKNIEYQTIMAEDTQPDAWDQTPSTQGLLIALILLLLYPACFISGILFAVVMHL